jgi:hypothetical protein
MEIMTVAFQENVKTEVCFVNDYRGAACWNLYILRGLKYTGRPLLNDGDLHTKIRAKYKKLYPTPQIYLLRHYIYENGVWIVFYTHKQTDIYTYKFILTRIGYKTLCIWLFICYLTYMF